MTFKEQTENVMTFIRDFSPSSESLCSCSSCNPYKTGEYLQMFFDHIQPQVYLILNHFTDFLLTICF